MLISIFDKKKQMLIYWSKRCACLNKYQWGVASQRDGYKLNFSFVTFILLLNTFFYLTDYLSKN